MRTSFPHVIFWALEALIWHPSSAFQANWTSPTDGDVFGPGEYILGQWLSDEAASNISFRLCNADAGPSMDDRDCGQAIQPAVVDNDDGSHQVTLAAPSVADPSHFYLQMFEDPGDPITSPTFIISPSNASASSISTTSTGDDASLSANAHSLPVVAQSRSPAATAAYAVPLSLAGAIVLIASIVGIYQRKKLLAERAADEKETTDFKEHFMHKRLRGFTFWHSRPQTDRALPTPQEKPDDAYTRMFVPQMHRTRTRGPRQATREPFSTRTTGKSVPAGLFKATLSPRIPYTSNESPAAHRFCSLPPPRDRKRTAEINAAVHESVVSHYLRPSPVPSPSPSPMKQAHIRKHSTPDCGGAAFVDMDKLYEEVARRIQ